MIRTFTKLENALKYDYSGFSFKKVLCKSRALLVKKTRFAKQSNSPTKTNLIKKAKVTSSAKLVKIAKVDSIKDLNKNDVLVKQLIDSDFIYSRKSVDKRVPGVVESTLSIKESNLVCTLDIFKLNTSIKQFIKILETLDTIKSEQKIELYVLCKNKHYLRLIDRMSRRYLLKDIIKLCTILPDLSGKSNKEKMKYLFILGEYEFSRNFLHQLVYYRVSLISKFNLKYERKTSGFYKIQNNLDDYKKLMFLFILIEKVLGKKNPINNRLIVKKVKLPVMKNINLTLGNKKNKVVSPLIKVFKIKVNKPLKNNLNKEIVFKSWPKLINVSKIKVSKPVKNNLNKEIVVKNLRVNNFKTVVSKRKKGLIFSKKAKKYPSVNRIEKKAVPLLLSPVISPMKNARLPTPMIKKPWQALQNKPRQALEHKPRQAVQEKPRQSSQKSPTWSHNKLVKQTGLSEHSERNKWVKRTDPFNSSPTTYMPSKYSRTASVSKPKENFTKKANWVKETYPRTDLVNSLSTIHKSSKYSRTDAVNNLPTNVTASVIKPKVNFIKKIDAVKEVYPAESNSTAPVTLINKPKVNFIKNVNPVKQAYPRKPYTNSSETNVKKGKYPQPPRK